MKKGTHRKVAKKNTTVFTAETPGTQRKINNETDKTSL
jgi:hypothetical protein